MKRIEWIDVVRGMAILLIIIGHSLYVYSFSNLAKVIFAVHVPVFFVLSGYLFKERDWKKTTTGLSTNVLLPYFGTSIIIVAISWIALSFPGIKGLTGFDSLTHAILAALYGIGTPSKLPGSQGLIVPAIGAIWFLLAMFVGNLMFNLTLKVTKRAKAQLVWMLVIAVVLATIGFGTVKFILLPWSINAALISQVFYWFGYALKQYDLVERWYWSYLVGGIILWALSAWSGFFYLNVGFAANPILASLGGMGGSYGLILLAKFIAEKTPRMSWTWLTWFGRESLIVMCFHDVDLDNFKIAGKLFTLSSSHLNNVIGVIIVIIYHVIFVSVVILLIPHLPIVRSVYMHRQFSFGRRKKQPA
ncbi:acyltransferase family protein [Furfurilactobacillus sp. WILCCON 0119]